MTDRAIHLVVGPNAHLAPLMQVGAWASGRVNELPEVHPTPEPHIILNGKNLNLAVRQACRVIHRISAPVAIKVAGREIMAAMTDEHAGEEPAVFSGDDLKRSVFQQYPVASIECVVNREVTNHILGAIRPKHSGHAGMSPGLVDIGMAIAAGLGTCVTGQRYG